MANACYITTTSYQTRYMQLSCTQTRNIESNTSTISWTLTVAGGTSNNYSTGETIVKINGTQVYYDAGTSYTEKVFPASKGSVSGTLTVPHDSDGTKTIEVSLKTAIYYTDVELGGTQSWTLDANPIKSTISVDGAFTMGSAGTIYISSENSNFRHTITCLWGDTSTSGINSNLGYKETIVSQTASTFISWTPPLTLAYIIPNNTSGVGSLVCETYLNGSLVGSSSITFTANVPSTVVPVIDYFIANTVNNDVPADWGLYIQGKSQCSLKALAFGSYGSSIRSYSIKHKIGGAVISSTSEGTSGVLNESGNVTFVVTVTDSRGRTASKDVTITVTPYSVPSVSSILSQRSDASGNVNDNGSYIRTSCECVYSSCNGKNSLLSCKVYYRKSGDDFWSSGVNYTSGSVVILAGNADVDSSYEVKYEISDAFVTVEYIDLVSTSFTTLDFKKGGKGFAIGKASEKDCFECAMDAEFTGKFSADLSELIVMQSYTADRLTVNSNATMDAYLDITKDGYTALGVVGVHTSHGSALLVVAHLSSPTQAKVTVRNVSSASVIVAPSADILYLKNI